MKIISAIGSFKGTISSIQINEIVKSFFEKQEHDVTAIPVADGGDGLLEALSFSMNAKNIELETVNALHKPIMSKVAILNKIGIIEMALASGLALLNKNELNPLKASTYGTGLLIKQLADLGVSEIILGIGGSATNDGGFGCLSALGFDFSDKNGNVLPPCAENLQYICSISDKNVPESIKNLKISIACDVTNPLLGQQGATYVYARQKGADDSMLAVLEKGMEHYTKTVANFCENDYSAFPGAGAAGGLGFGLMALLGAKLIRGADIVLDKNEFFNKIKTADIVITGEGKLDSQTAYGKLPQIIAHSAKENGIKCIALCGSSSIPISTAEKMGISQVYELINFAPIEECMNNTVSVIEKALKHIIF